VYPVQKRTLECGVELAKAPFCRLAGAPPESGTFAWRLDSALQNGGSSPESGSGLRDAPYFFHVFLEVCTRLQLEDIFQEGEGVFVVAAFHE